jgi:hypothetical protein
MPDEQAGRKKESAAPFFPVVAQFETHSVISTKSLGRNAAVTVPAA